MKQIKLSFIKNENNLFPMILLQNQEVFKEKEVTASELSDCLNDFCDDITNLRKYCAVFKVKKITINIKE